MKKLNFLLLLSAILIFTCMNSCTEKDTTEPEDTELADGEDTKDEDDSKDDNGGDDDTDDTDGDDDTDDGNGNDDEDEDGEEEAFVPVIITVEAETATLVEDWKLSTDIEGYTGDGYIIWEGPDLFWKGEANIGNRAPLEYKIEITKAGTYRFEWRSRIGKGDRWDEHNDS